MPGMIQRMIGPTHWRMFGAVAGRRGIVRREASGPWMTSREGRLNVGHMGGRTLLADSSWTCDHRQPAVTIEHPGASRQFHPGHLLAAHPARDDTEVLLSAGGLW